MKALFIVVITLAGYLLAYFTYGRFLRDKILDLDPRRRTPAHKFSDGIDYVPARKEVLFGHHFASIAGLGPIMGPAIAVIWGWLPAFLWVLFGSVFLGAVHDFAALVVSLRHDGISIGRITEKIIDPRAKILFLFIIFFLLALAMGVFALINSILFRMYPEGVIPVFGLMIVAVFMGISLYKLNLPAFPVTIAGVLLMFALITLGIRFPFSGPEQNTWIYILLAYAFLASILPVWILLQPRDYLNSFLLYAGLILLSVGIFINNPQIVAPAVNMKPDDLPSAFPFLFITVACGAISGFHNLVSSGTTVRQIRTEADAQFISYGGMLTEGFLAVLVILAATAGVATSAEWNTHYGNFKMAQGLKPQLEIFIKGGGSFVSSFGIPVIYAQTFLSVMIVSFAMTTLDSATRLLRYNVEEIGNSFGVPFLQNRYVAGGVAVAAIGYFALMKIGGQPAGLTLWQLFGTTNQLLAGLGLLTITLFLFKGKKRYIYTLIPMLFMLVVTLSAMIIKIGEFLRMEDKHYSLIFVSFIILGMTVWLLAEAAFALHSSNVERTEQQ